jgi:SOS-response transcriptional repressor LexA
MTPKERKLLVFIKATLDSEGVPPSYEMARLEFGLASKSGIARMISSLRAQGYLRKPTSGEQGRTRNTFLTEKAERFLSGSPAKTTPEADTARAVINQVIGYFRGRSAALRQSGNPSKADLLFDERERFEAMAFDAYVKPLEV